MNERFEIDETDRLIAFVLRTGVAIAAVTIALGAALYLARYGGAHPDLGVFRDESADLKTVLGTLHRAAAGSSRGLIQLGILILMATPIARVALSFVLFVKERDRLYAGITVLVLAVLLFGVFGAH